MSGAGQRRLTRLAIVLGAAAVGGALILFFHRTEPAYHGKTASAWITDLARVRSVPFIAPTPTFGAPAKTALTSPGPSLSALGLTVIQSNGVFQITGVTAPAFPANNPIRLKVSPDASASEALDALRALGSAAVPHLIRALKKEDTFLARHYLKLHAVLPARLQTTLPPPQPPAAATRNAALLALRELGAGAAPAAPVLTEFLQNPDANVRGSALAVLRHLAFADKSVREHLNRVLPSEGMDSFHAVEIIAALDLRGERSAWALAEALHSSSRPIRRTAADILQGLGAQGAPAVPGLTRLLQSDDSELRFLSATALGNIGGRAKSAQASLVEALHDPNQSVRDAAAAALRSIESERKTNQ